MPKTRLVVLFGGRSAEHEVSCVSARHVLEAVDHTRYDVAAIGITRDGRWIAADAAVAALPEAAPSLPSPDDLGASAEVDPLPAVAATDGAATVVFPLLHGPMGEDGTIQGLLELAGVPYVGAGVLASSVCMDKGAAKDVLGRHGLPQPRWVCRREQELLPADLAAAAADDLGLPVFVKPANMGSSVGVSRADTADELAAAVTLALRYDEYVVIEEAVVRPREIEVAVLGNAEVRASLPGEVVPSHEFYDFEDKYEAGTAGLCVPAELEPAQVSEVQALAVAAYRALRVDGMARVDLFFEAEGRGFLVNEVNTIPGFTPISMYPRLWEASGLPYPRLVDELVRLAIERHRRRSTFATTR